MPGGPRQHTGNMRAVWIWWPLLVVLMAAAIWVFAADGLPIVALGYGAFAAFVAWFSCPFRGRNALTHAQRSAQGQSGVVIYWRPGCMFCAALRRRLGAVGGSATWINIWQDADAAAFVRSHNDGNETVPTVVVDGLARTNPPAELVRAALTGTRHGPNSPH